MKKINIKKKEASSLSRIFQHLDSPHFGVVSASLDSLGEKENAKRSAKLKGDIRSLGRGFIALDSKWELEGVVSSEISFFVPQLTEKEALKLGKKYQQWSVLSKLDDGRFVHRGTSSDAGVGKVLDVFTKTLVSEKDFKGAFFKLLKGSHRNKRVKFIGSSELTQLPYHCCHARDSIYEPICAIGSIEEYYR